jgi:hypothetical protein
MDEVAAAIYCEYLLSLLKDSPALSLLEEKMFTVEGWTPETEVGKAAWAEGKAEGEAKGSAAMLLVVVDGLGLVRPTAPHRDLHRPRRSGPMGQACNRRQDGRRSVRVAHPL